MRLLGIGAGLALAAYNDALRGVDEADVQDPRHADHGLTNLALDLPQPFEPDSQQQASLQVERVGPRGLEPRTCGLRVRCSARLS